MLHRKKLWDTPLCVSDSKERIDKYDEQEEILQKHNDNVNSIEGELETARGDRRQHLIDQLNEEIAAQRAAQKEEQRIKKEQEAEQRRLKRQLEQAEKRIDELETAISEVEADLCREENLTDHNKLHEPSKKLDGLKEELSVEYDKWMELQEV